LRWLKHEGATERHGGRGADIAPVWAGIAETFVAGGILTRRAERCLRDYVARQTLVPVRFLLIMATGLGVCPSY